jgi:hypothetical protein
MAIIQEFAGKLNVGILEIMKTLDKPAKAPEWWNWECDRALIMSMSRHGLWRVWNWIVDRSLPFRKFIPRGLVAEFERVAEAESSRLKKIRPPNLDIPEELEFVFVQPNRTARALSVIKSITQLVKKYEAKKEKQREGGLPMRLNLVTIHSLGTLRPGFECKVAPYPVGFCSERQYKLPHWPSRQRFRCEIEEKDGNPLFRVTLLVDPPQTFTAPMASDAWNLAVAAREALLRESGEQFEEAEQSGSRMGNTMFGLLHHTVLEELARLPGAELMKSLNRDLEITVSPRPFKIVLPVFAG